MASLQNYSNFESQIIPAEILVPRVIQIHDSISKLESLRPSKQVNSLFTHLVNLCTLPSNIDIKALAQEVQDMRENLILLCGRSEGLLEFELATFISRIPKPLNNLNIFPYFGNYVKLADLEFKILSKNGVVNPTQVAFVGSGPMPLSSIVMATHHMTSTHFDNYDIDEAANDVARKIVASDPEFEKRMKFVTCDIIEVGEKLGEYDCIFLAALVGMNKEEKLKIVEHIRKYMKAGGFLLVRSANGARAFLYPSIEEHDLSGFEILSIFHPTDEVINTVILLKKPISQS